MHWKYISSLGWAVRYFQIEAPNDASKGECFKISCCGTSWTTRWEAWWWRTWWGTNQNPFNGNPIFNQPVFHGMTLLTLWVLEHCSMLRVWWCLMVGHGYSGGTSSWPAKITPVDGIDGGDTWCSKVPSTSQCLMNLDSLRHCRTRQRGSLIAEVTIAPALWGPKTTAGQNHSVPHGGTAGAMGSRSHPPVEQAVIGVAQSGNWVSSDAKLMFYLPYQGSDVMSNPKWLEKQNE